VIISRGEMWLVDFGTPGRVPEPEQAKARPALVLSVDEINHVASMSIVVPATTTIQPLLLSLSNLKIDPPEGGLDRPSALQFDQTRAVSHRRFLKRLGAVSAHTLAQTKERLSLVLGF
jgi:mRNA interferase MazF